MMRIALIQSELAWGDVKKNLDNFDKKVDACQDCDVILLPEMFVSGCMMVKKTPEVAVAEKVAVAARYDEVEKYMSIWAARWQALIVGSTVYRTEGIYYNRLIAAFPDGTCQYYDKRHCFRMGGEKEHFSAGNKHLVFDFRGIRVATFICYDLRFPVWCRNVQHYDLAVFVANWPESRRDIWSVLLKARAIENQSFVAGVNCVGEDKNGLVYTGDSLVVDARGQIIGEALPGKEEIITVDLDVDKLKQFREKFPVLDDRDSFRLVQE